MKNEQGYISKHISDLYNSLKQKINDLEKIIHSLLNISQANFLVAYQTTMSKISQQLQQIKQKAFQHQKSYSTNNKINQLQKQIIIFREQAMNAWKNYNQAKMDAQFWKKKSYQFQVDLKGTNQKWKEDLKKLRQLQQINSKMARQLQSPNLENSNLPENNSLQQKKFPKVYKKTFKNQYSQYIQKILRNISSDENNIQIACQRLNCLFKKLLHENQKQVKQLNKRINRLNKELPMYNRSQIEDFFIRCIQTVKKQISKRRLQIKQCQLQDFLKIDKMKVLQLFVNEERVIHLLFRLMFKNYDKNSVLEGLPSFSYKKVKEMQSQPTQRQKLYSEIFDYSLFQPKIKIKQSRSKARQIRNHIKIQNGKLIFNNSIYKK